MKKPFEMFKLNSNERIVYAFPKTEKISDVVWGNITKEERITIAETLIVITNKRVIKLYV